MISDKIKDDFFDFMGISFYHSSFNTLWFKEFGIYPRVIFDVGSYDFGDAIRFKNEFSDCSVFAFEADPERYKTSSLYAFGIGVVTENLALYKEEGEISFYQSSTPQESRSSQGSIYQHTDLCKRVHPYINQDSIITVKCDTIENYCTKNSIGSIDLAHIDVEGAEMDVILGMCKIKPKILYIETQRDFFIGAPKIEETDSVLKNLGYELILDATSDRLYLLK